MAIFTKILQKIELWHCLSIILPTIVLRGNRHLKELPKKFWDHIMEKKKFLLFLKNYQPTFQIGKNNLIKKWLNSAVKKYNYPPKNTPYEVQKFLHRGRYNHQVWKQIFFSKSLSQIDINSSANLEHTIKNDTPVRCQKIWKIWPFEAYSELYATFVLKWHLILLKLLKLVSIKIPFKYYHNWYSYRIY